MSVTAIIPAAGTGIRMGGPTPKQFLCLDGVPVMVHTLRKFAGAESVNEMVLALRPEDMDRAKGDLVPERISKPLRLVAGGATRQETVARALGEVSSSAEIILVHDAVRPFIELEMIERVIEAARRSGAAILGIPSVDTVKQIERQVVIGTIPRERIVLAQTPQAFRASILREAFARAAADGFNGTDEACLVERLGYAVTVLMGSDRNIKITKPSDLPLARLYIAQERERSRSR